MLWQVRVIRQGMAEPFVDTDLIIRLLTGDDKEKQRKAKSFFERIERGELRVSAPLTVIADTVYVLSSPRLYHLPRTEIAALLTPLLRLPGFRIAQRPLVIQALDIYRKHNCDFGDAVIIASMYRSESKILYSFDEDFDHLEGITRREP